MIATAAADARQWEWVARCADCCEPSTGDVRGLAAFVVVPRGCALVAICEPCHRLATFGLVGALAVLVEETWAANDAQRRAG